MKTLTQAIQDAIGETLSTSGGSATGILIKHIEPLIRNIPDSAVCFFKDGNSWCCVHGDFINLQESPAGFGDTFEEALKNLEEEK